MHDGNWTIERVRAVPNLNEEVMGELRKTIVKDMFDVDGKENVARGWLLLASDAEVHGFIVDYIELLMSIKHDMKKFAQRLDGMPKDFTVVTGDFDSLELHNVDSWNLYSAWRGIQKLEGMDDDYRWVDEIYVLDDDDTDWSALHDKLVGSTWTDCDTHITSLVGDGAVKIVHFDDKVAWLAEVDADFVKKRLSDNVELTDGLPGHYAIATLAKGSPAWCKIAQDVDDGWEWYRYGRTFEE